MEPAHVRLSGDLSGEYVIEDRRPDGRVLLRPDLSVKAMLSRHGERELTPEEFEQHFGALPTDGEGWRVAGAPAGPIVPVAFDESAIERARAQLPQTQGAHPSRWLP